MKVGLYFGSFNPVHVGHLVIANYMSSFTDLDEVWMIVSPLNPFKNKERLMSPAQRLALVRKSVGWHPRLKVSDVEFSLPQPSYTVHTLERLSIMYPDRQFVIILGSDSLVKFNEWKDSKKIASGYTRYIYPRPGISLEGIDLAGCRIFDAPLIGISSTMIRESLTGGKDIRFWLPAEVREEIIRIYSSGK